MSLLPPKSKLDLHKAIYEYFTLNGFTNAAEAFKADSGLTDEDIESNKGKSAALKNVLEKRWLKVIILQKKQIENENLIKDLQKQISTYEAIGAEGGSAAAAAVAATSLSSAKKNAPLFPRTVKFDLLGHRSSITCVQFHPFLNQLVSGSDDGSMRIWDCESGKYEETMSGHTKGVNGIDFRPNSGDLMASCSSDMSIKLWPFGIAYEQQKREHPGINRTSVRTLMGHDHAVSSVKFVPPNGDQLVSASRDGTIKVWDIETGYCVLTMVGHDGWVRQVSVLDQETIATAGHDKTVRLWSLSSGENLATFSGHENVVECVAFAQKDGKDVVLSGSRDKTIRVWSVETRTCEAVLEGHENWVRALYVVPSNPRYVISVGDDKAILCWDLNELRCVKTIRDAHSNFVTAVSLCKLHGHFATGGTDSVVKVWDTSI